MTPRPLDALKSHSVLYGVFDSREEAEAAADDIVTTIEPEAAWLPRTDLHQDHLSNRDVPMAGTEAARGPIVGAAIGLGGAAVVGIAILVLSRLTELAVPAQHPLEAGMVLLVGALLGALAGGLALSSENRPAVKQLARQVDQGRTVLTVLTDQDDREVVVDRLEAHGALSTGRVG